MHAVHRHAPVARCQVLIRPQHNQLWYGRWYTGLLSKFLQFVGVSELSIRLVYIHWSTLFSQGLDPRFPALFLWFPASSLRMRRNGQLPKPSLFARFRSNVRPAAIAIIFVHRSVVRRIEKLIDLMAGNWVRSRYDSCCPGHHSTWKHSTSPSNDRACVHLPQRMPLLRSAPSTGHRHPVDARPALSRMVSQLGLCVSPGDQLTITRQADRQDGQDGLHWSQNSESIGAANEIYEFLLQSAFSNRSPVGWHLQLGTPEPAKTCFSLHQGSA
jgi:hypothetical protein